MRLKQAREARGWTQEQLAARVRPKMTRGYLARLELGYHTPSLGMLDRLAKALKTSVGDLLGERRRKR